MVVTDELSVVVVLIDVVSAGRSSVFAHAASAKASENTTEGRMKRIRVPRLTLLNAVARRALAAKRWGPLQAPYERGRRYIMSTLNRGVFVRPPRLRNR